MKNQAVSDHILISGYAKLPAHITSEEVYKTLVMVAVVNRRSGEIVDAECSMVTELARQFIAKLMIGYNLNDGLTGLLEQFRNNYYGHAKRAVETSLKMIYSKYMEIKSL
ncbi:MAG: DUF3870 domain-containing protein [Clostridiales bacterium]|nr:DUF3870 domain-containing protein [Clostridiales bacterium]